MRNSFVPNIVICNGPCITAHVSLMWGRSLHLRCTLGPSSVLQRLWCLRVGVVGVAWKCTSGTQRSRRGCTLQRRCRRVLSIDHHGRGERASPYIGTSVAGGVRAISSVPKFINVWKKDGTLEYSTVAKLTCFPPTAACRRVRKAFGLLWASVERGLAAACRRGAEIKGVVDTSVQKGENAG